MDQELDTLAERTRELVSLVRRLADDNERLRADKAQMHADKAQMHADQAQLRAELAASMDARSALNGRMAQARAKVETALSRLPTPGTEAQDEAQDGEH